MAPTFNLADLFELVARVIPDREALVSGPTRLTYRQLDERSTRLADALDRKVGVRPGDHVGLDLYNCCEYVEATFACFKLRAVPININYRYVAAELVPLFANSGVVGVLCDALTEEAVRGAAGDAWVVKTGAEYDDLVAAGAADRTFGERSADDPSPAFYTGHFRMRGVVWRHEDIFFSALGSGNPGGPPITTPEEIVEHARTNRVQRLAPYLAPDDLGCDEFVALSLGPLVHAQRRGPAFWHAGRRAR